MKLLVGFCLSLVIASGWSALSLCTYEVRRACESLGEPTACLTTECSKVWKTSTKDRKFRRDMLDLHNKLRTVPFEGFYGGNMMEMTWDDELEKTALTWAHSLCNSDDFKHDVCRTTPKWNRVGQNLFHQSSMELELGVNATEVAMSWYNEVNSATSSKVFPLGMDPSIGHFTQMMWANTYKLGCAYVIASDSYFGYKAWIACNYGPAGNYFGEDIFQKSRRLGSSCPIGSARIKSGLCRLRNQRRFDRRPAEKSILQNQQETFVRPIKVVMPIYSGDTAFRQESEPSYLDTESAWGIAKPVAMVNSKPPGQLTVIRNDGLNQYVREVAPPNERTNTGQQHRKVTIVREVEVQPMREYTGQAKPVAMVNSKPPGQLTVLRNDGLNQYVRELAPPNERTNFGEQHRKVTIVREVEVQPMREYTGQANPVAKPVAMVNSKPPGQLTVLRNDGLNQYVRELAPPNERTNFGQQHRKVTIVREVEVQPMREYTGLQEPSNFRRATDDYSSYSSHPRIKFVVNGNERRSSIPWSKRQKRNAPSWTSANSGDY